MKKRNNFLGTLIILGSFCFVPLQNSWAVEDTIIAVVNNDIITHRDLTEYLDSVHFQLKSEGRSQAEIDKIMAESSKDGIKNLIEDRIMLSEANRLGMEIRKEIVDKKVADIQKQYPSEQAFLDGLLSEGASISDLRKKITDQMKIKYLVEEQVKSKIFVNPQEVTDYYKANIESFKKPERVNLDSIYIPFGKEKNKEEAKAKAAEAAALLKEGKNFEDVAKQYSHSPSIGILAKGEMLPAIEEMVMNLKKGEVSQPLEVENGVYILKLKAKLPSEMTTLEEAKNQIYDFLFNKNGRPQFRSFCFDRR